MAISINWGTRVITVPKTDLPIVSSGPPQIRELDVNAFRLELKSLEDDEEGMPYPDTHYHVAPITVGGVQLARVVEIINGYTITFEADSYAVNLINANNNISDVANLNQVSIRSANSAGLIIQPEVGSQVWDELLDDYTVPNTFGDHLSRIKNQKV